MILLAARARWALLIMIGARVHRGRHQPDAGRPVLQHRSRIAPNLWSARLNPTKGLSRDSSAAGMGSFNC